MSVHLRRLGVAAVVALALGGFSPVPLRASDAPLGEITRGGPDVVQPTHSTDNLPTRYGLGYPVQVGPTTAALVCNLRVVGPRCTDFEDGSDAIVFTDLQTVSKGTPSPLARNEKETDPETGAARFIVKYPVAVGFWPLGARQPDGSVHPGAGKGFGLCQALSLVGRGNELTWDMFSQPGLKCYTETMQLSFDGQQVTVTSRELIRAPQKWPVPDGWGIACPGLQTAIPDGSDLLLAVLATKDEVNRSGVCRFRFLDGRWQPVAFTPVAAGAEPSLARRADGSLVFLVRPDEETGYAPGKSIRLWASTDGGVTWPELLHAVNERPRTPVSVHAAPDGTIFVMANTLGMTNPARTALWWHLDRSRLALWQLAEGAAEFKPPQPRLIRDCVEEFGLRDGYVWNADHPISATVRLSDGAWHGLLAYRLFAYSVSGDKVGELLTPQTGCYLEEVFSGPLLTPPWKF